LAAGNGGEEILMTDVMRPLMLIGIGAVGGATVHLCLHRL
jgi:hypothetical protein